MPKSLLFLWRSIFSSKINKKPNTHKHTRTSSLELNAIKEAFVFHLQMVAVSMINTALTVPHLRAIAILGQTALTVAIITDAKLTQED